MLEICFFVVFFEPKIGVPLNDIESPSGRVEPGSAFGFESSAASGIQSRGLSDHRGGVPSTFDTSWY